VTALAPLPYSSARGCEQAPGRAIAPKPIAARAPEETPPAPDQGFANVFEDQLAIPAEPPPELANLVAGLSIVRPEQPPPSPQVAQPEIPRGLPTIALTPLEQAIVDLIVGPQQQQDTSILDDEEPLPLPEVPERGGLTEVATSPIASRTEPVHKAPAIAAATLPAETEQAAPTSHVHLVLDDGAERVVMTVAVRGSEVNVSLRASDDHTGAALARNAATLDHALRARKLELADFTTQRDPRKRREREQDKEQT
jgi:hypothetical protein